MKKRIIAFLSVLVLMATLFPAGASTTVSAETADQQYQVGYSIKNLNPWVSNDFVSKAFVTDNDGNITGVKVGDDGVPTVLGTLGEDLFTGYSTSKSTIYPYLCSLVGNQVDWNSVMYSVYDDNGDNKYNDGDGIFATCTAVTYGKGTADEKTVLFITVDAMKAWTSLVTDVRKEIEKAYGIAVNQIMVSSNHTHSGPNLVDYMGNGYVDSTIFDTEAKKSALKNDRHSYYEYVVKQIVTAAGESLEDRAAATMTRGSVDATVATAALKYNSGNGYQMNAIRHYEKTVANGHSNASSSSIKNVSYISSNATPSSTKLNDAVALNGYTNFKQGTVTTNLSDEPDNTMYVLRFSFDDDREPVVFVNWRAHSTMNSGVDKHALSGDYANGLRTVLKDTYGCRAAFFLGAAGNVVCGPNATVYTESSRLIKEKMDWLYEARDKSSATLKVDDAKKTFIYGRLLAEIADYCMDNCMTDPLPAGEINTYQRSWIANKQKYSEELKTAALELHDIAQEAMDKASYTGSMDKYFSENASKYFPYRYPNTKDGAIINSRLHYKSVYSQANASSVADKVSGIELDAIMLGKNVAFVTSPNELVDYYNDFSDYTGGTLTYAEIDKLNDWYDLKNDDYGMPFVLGYSNQNSGYIGSWLDHHSNSQEFYKITGKGQHGHLVYSPGTYESLTSSFALGEGEALMDVYKGMLEVVSGKYDRISECQHCNKVVTWKPLFAENTGDKNWVGHYYLVDDLLNSACRTINANDKLCLDLNGRTISSTSRAFNTNESVPPTNAVVSIMDSVGTGKVIGNHNSNNPNGGTIKFIGGTNTLNIYGGTFSFNNIDGEYDATVNHGTGRGGVISLSGVLNLYGGTIQGTKMANISARSGFGSYVGQGGAILNSGRVNVYGGSIISGSVPDTGAGPCVYMSGSTCKLMLSGNGDVEDVYFASSNGTNLSVSGKYSGTAELTFASKIKLTDNMDIGDSINANLADATISCTNDPDVGVCTDGADMKLSFVTDNTAAIVRGSIGKRAYNTLNEAVASCSDCYIQLYKDVSANVTVPNDVYLNLAGFDVNGKVTVSSGKTLYVMDSETDDYTVADGKYGKISSVTGAVSGVPVEANCAEDGYLMVTEKDGVSFHRINLQISCMTLRPDVNGESVPGLYYKSYFAGDEKVADRIAQFGVALSATGEPDESAISERHASEFTGFKGGKGANVTTSTGTLLKGIMKTGNKDLINNRNANIPVYGRAYVLLDDGTYLFGESVNRTLRTQVEMIEDLWKAGKLDAEQRTALVEMCSDFYSVVRYWDIPSILEAVPKAES